MRHCAFPANDKRVIKAGRAARPRATASKARSAAFFRRTSMSEQEQAGIRLDFAKVKQEHADFDAAINAMIGNRLRRLADPADEEEEAGAEGQAQGA